MDAITSYFQRNKHQILPEVNDFTKDHPTIKYSKDIKNMPFNTWIYMHPSAYNLLNIGHTAIACLACAGMTVLFRKIPIAPFFTLALSILYLYRTIKKIKQYPLTKDLTLYDLYMKEEPEETKDG